MSDELEAAGGLVSAGLAAKAIDAELEGEGRGPVKSARHGAPTCLNCGAALSGPYCQACGQPAHLHRSLLHLLEELLHGLLHFDAKAWRTVPLLACRPGVLTRRYIDGQRMRYVSPLAIFLFSVFMMFFVFSFSAGPGRTLGSQAEAAIDRAGLLTDVANADQGVARAQAAVQGAQARKEDLPDAESDLAEARTEQRVARAALQFFDLSAAQAAASAASGLPSGTAAASSAVARGSSPAVAGWVTELRGIDTGSARLDKAWQQALANPDLTLYKLKSGASKYSFMLVPISLPFLWLMFFWHRGITMYDHAVFSLYSLSFMSLLFVLAALLEAVHLGGLAGPLALAVPPIHMALQLRDTYRLSTFSMLWRTAVLTLVCVIVFALFALFLIAVTVA